MSEPFYSLYSDLGLTRDATEEEIKIAYRSRILEEHSDKNPNADTDRFQKVKHAYDILKDKEERRKHDSRLRKKGKKAGTIAVFGQSGVGKSSLINQLLESNLRVSDKAVGCTFKTDSVEAVSEKTVPIDFYGSTFLDTAGVGESDQGTVPNKEAVQNLISLILNITHGLSLMIYVVDRRLLGPVSTNYKLFVETIAENKVPCICVVTGVDKNAQDTQNWIKENEGYFKREGMNFKEIVAVCLGTDTDESMEKVLKIRREESGKRVWEAIDRNMSSDPVIFPKSGVWKKLIDTLSAIYGAFVEKVFGAKTEVVSKVQEAYKWLKSIGLPDQDARELSDLARN